MITKTILLRPCDNSSHSTKIAVKRKIVSTTHKSNMKSVSDKAAKAAKAAILCSRRFREMFIKRTRQRQSLLDRTLNSACEGVTRAICIVGNSSRSKRSSHTSRFASSSGAGSSSGDPDPEPARPRLIPRLLATHLDAFKEVLA